ncbi:MAG TPA: KilA-N domain-containing protein, partial [Thiotrichaceae bacterium]|nr:KilA-N domain-containing protein [Thiotrichaceae bacterium]
MGCHFMTTQLISRDFHGATIRQRSSDGYLNATDMCQSTGKRLNDYRRLKTTKEFFNVLSGYAGIPADLIIQITKTGPNDKRGTWIEPHAAINLAQWCSPEFAAMVTKWIFELLTKGSVSLDPSLEIAPFAQAKAEELD